MAWEILRGPRLVDRVKEYQIAVRLLDRLEILPFTLTSAKIAVEHKFRRKGKAVNLVNILIAVVAIENQSKLVTRDSLLSIREKIVFEFGG